MDNIFRVLNLVPGSWQELRVIRGILIPLAPGSCLVGFSLLSTNKVENWSNALGLMALYGLPGAVFPTLLCVNRVTGQVIQHL